MARYALESVAAQVLEPGSSGLAMVPVTGDSLRIRDSSSSYLLDVSQQRRVNGFVRITSPLIHDNLVGLVVNGQTNHSLIRWPVTQELTPQDTLSLFATGDIVPGRYDLAMLQVFYENLAGIDANLIDRAELKTRFIELFMPRIFIMGAAIGPGWAAPTVINSLDDQLKANQEYAWLGIAGQMPVNSLAVGMVSPDWGNLRIACPGDTVEQTDLSHYFVRLSDDSGRPCIPVFNASQKQNILLTLLNNEIGADLSASLVLARLKPRTAKGGKS